MVATPRIVAAIEGRTALQVASLFDNEFTMAVMVALLSLRRRASDDGYFLKLVADYAEPSRDFTEIILPYRGTSTEAPELANFAHLMNRAHSETMRMISKDPDETAELGTALDALSASFDEVDTTLKGIPQTVLTPSVLLQWSTATQALRKVVYVNWTRESRVPQSQFENSRPKLFPARLPSGRNVSISGLDLR
ncbi:MAG: hypothetical protein Q9161_003562 [Pseudevernia consocians]